jgi:hypothetical protein
MTEAPLASLEQPDLNWADFCAGLLLSILRAATPPREVEIKIHAAITAAAHAIVRRNVRPEYSNISVMGGVVTALAGEFLDNSVLRTYGERRLTAQIAHVEAHGDFTEYNSPTYSFVTVEECERLLYVSRDPGLRALAEKLLYLIWERLFIHIDPYSGVLAGPHSRAYRNFPNSDLAPRLERAGYPINVNKRPSDPGGSIMADGPELIPWVDPPADLLSTWNERREEIVSSTRQLYVHDRTGVTLNASVTRHKGMSLGSVSLGSFFTQARPVIAYLPAEDGSTSVVRVRALRDGRDFASVGVLSAMDGFVLLGASTVFSNLGDYHLYLDPLPSGSSLGSVELAFEISSVAPVTPTITRQDAGSASIVLDESIPCLVQMISLSGSLPAPSIVEVGEGLTQVRIPLSAGADSLAALATTPISFSLSLGTHDTDAPHATRIEGGWKVRLYGLSVESPNQPIEYPKDDWWRQRPNEYQGLPEA